MLRIKKCVTPASVIKDTLGLGELQASITIPSHHAHSCVAQLLLCCTIAAVHQECLVGLASQAK